MTPLRIFPRLLAGLSVLSLLIIAGCAGTPAPPTIAVSITPPSVTLIGGGTQTFTATVTNDSANAGVTWAASTGTITATGAYTAPAVITTTSATVTATSKTDTTKSATATVTLTPISVTITTTPVAMIGGATQTFAATVAADGANAGVTWTASTGSITAAGVYTAPAVITTASASVTATSKTDPTKSASVTVTLTPISVGAISPGSVTLNGGGTQGFTVTVSSDGSNSGVTWSIGAGVGTLSNVTTTSVTYNAPAVIAGTTPVTVSLVATSIKDPTKASAAATITLNPIAVTISTVTVGVSLDSGQTMTIATTVANDSSASGVTFVATGAGSVNPLTAAGNSPSTTLTATGAVASSVTVTATSVKDATKTVSTSSITINPVLTITTAAGALPGATVGVAYSGTTVTTSGGTGAKTYTVASGALPTGLTLNSATGVISGTVTGAPSTYSFTIKVTDSATTPFSATSGTYTITVIPAPLVWTAPTAQTLTYTVGTAITPLALTTTGGTGAITYTVNSGTLPAGLSIVGNQVTGTPTAPTVVAGNAVTFLATDSATVPVTAVSATVTIVVNPVTLAITTASLPIGVVGSAYSAQLTSTGGIAPINWTLTVGSLTGTGLSFSTSGLLTGTPITTQNALSLTFQAKDSATNQQQTKTATLSLTVTNALTVTTTSLPNGFVGTAYSQTLAAAGGSGTGYTWTVTSGTGLSAVGLSLSAAGVITGTPTATEAAGSFTVKVTDSASNTATATLALTVNGTLGVTTGSTLPAGFVGTAYSQTLAASGGSGSGYTWTITSGASTLTAVGLNMSTGGVISGTPTATGTASFTVQVKDSANNTASGNLSLTVNAGLAITTSSVPNGTVGVAYSSQLVATGGTGTGYTWTVTSGTGLSAVGLTLSSGGLITGTPSTTETATSFTVKVTDSGSNIATATLALIVNYGTLSITTTGTASGTINTAYSQTFNATGGSGNYTWSITSGLSALNTLGLSFSTGGVLSGTPNATGSYGYTVQVKDTTTNNTVSAPYTLVVNSATSSCGSGSLSVSGTVNYTGSKTGRIYLALNGNCGTSEGTSISSAGAFTIRGVSPGTYTLNAFTDTLGFGVSNAADPSGSTNVTVSSSNLTGVTLTLTDPGTVTLTSAPSVSVSPFNNGVIALYQPIKNNGIEQAASYTLQWGNAGLTSIAGSQTVPALGSNGDTIVLNSAAHGGLTNGSTFYFRIYATSSGTAVSPYSSIVGPITIGAPTGGATVSGAVTFTPTATGPLYAGFYNGNTGSIYLQYIPTPVSAQAYTVQVPISATAVYQPVEVLDQNNNGTIDVGDLQNITNTYGNGTPLAFTGNTTGQNVTLSSAGSAPAVFTQSSQTQGSVGISYQLTFSVRGGVKLPVAATLVSGPNVTTPVDMANCAVSGSSCGHGFQFTTGISGTPSVGDTYGFSITYSDGTSETLNGAITAVLTNAFATNLAPTTGSSVSTQPTFSWTDPSNAANYSYSFTLNGPTGTIWSIPSQSSNSCNNFTSSTTSIPWNVDPTGCGSTPSVSSLTLGTNYQWQINVYDSNNNQAITNANYQP